MGQTCKWLSSRFFCNVHAKLIHLEAFQCTSNRSTKMKWPRKYTDFLAIGFFLICIVTIFFFELLVVLPYYQDDCSLAPLHLFAAFYLVFNILTNIYFLYATDTSTLKILMPSSLLPGWHYCCLCEANSPPRAYHCTICDRCILRRDHHCPFSGKIVINNPNGTLR